MEEDENINEFDESYISPLNESLTDNNSYDSIHDILYQQNVTRGKQKILQQKNRIKMVLIGLIYCWIRLKKKEKVYQGKCMKSITR